MNFRKTDVFSGIGVFVIELVITWCSYLKGNSNMLLVISLLCALTISVLVIYILKKKQKSADDLEQINKKVRELQNRCNFSEQEIDRLDSELVNYINHNFYLTEMSVTRQNILYALSNKAVINEGVIAGVINSVLRIFEGDIEEKTSVNISLFLENSQNEYYIYYSLKHSPGTVSRLRLGNESLVGRCFSEKKSISCSNIDNRKASVPFVELGSEKRKYVSILAIPGLVDDQCFCSLVITSNVEYELDDTYKKYRDAIDGHIELLAAILLLNSIIQED